MIKIAKNLFIPLVIGVMISISTIVVPVPSSEIISGPSCPVCQDVNGGRGQIKDRGLPLAFYYKKDLPWLLEQEQRAKINHVVFFVDTLFWAIIIASISWLARHKKYQKYKRMNNKGRLND